jgi:hypothetical protein
MKIDTDDWVTLRQACAESGLSLSTGYRLASHLKIVEMFFGVKCVHKSHVQTMKNNRRSVGNQRWIASGEEAAAAAEKSVKSRMRRVAESGLTKSEKKRNKRLAVIGRTLGGRRARQAD